MESGDSGERHLAQSALYKENVTSNGHSSVWGSYFDIESRSWGYACCHVLDRGIHCPAAVAVDDSAQNSSSAVAAPAVEDEVVRKLRQGVVPAEDNEPLRSSFSSSEEYLFSFICHWFHNWAAMEKGSVEAAASSKSEQQTREAMLPLLLQLRRKEVPQEFVLQLARFVELASEREYAQANDVYIGITIGKALWHSHLDLGEQRAHWGQGCSLRTMQKQIVEKDHKNATLFDKNPEVQRYVHGLKRLVTHMQKLRPSEDLSKMGHSTAPVPRRDELGLPVARGIRDSDGQGREPEFCDPSEAYAMSNDRGLAFGAESGRAHPFHGIGNARGV